jgi:hypothetical protein
MRKTLLFTIFDGNGHLSTFPSIISVAQPWDWSLEINIIDSNPLSPEIQALTRRIIGFLCQFGPLSTAKDRFVSRHSNAIILETLSLQEEGVFPEPIR